MQKPSKASRVKELLGVKCYLSMPPHQPRQWLSMIQPQPLD